MIGNTLGIRIRRKEKTRVRAMPEAAEVIAGDCAGHWRVSEIEAGIAELDSGQHVSQE